MEAGTAMLETGQAAESARAVNAGVYTVGDDIVLAAGRYAPKTVAGRHLLAHELAHTVQQRRADRNSGAVLQRQPAGVEAAASLRSPRFKDSVKLEACFEDEDRLREGDPDTDAVTRVQQALLDLPVPGSSGESYDLGPMGADGNYGPRTAAAVRKFKKDERLGFEQFGDVGPGTMHRLDQLFGPAPAPQPGGGGAGTEGGGGALPGTIAVPGALQIPPVLLGALLHAPPEVTAGPAASTAPPGANDVGGCIHGNSFINPRTSGGLVGQIFFCTDSAVLASDTFAELDKMRDYKRKLDLGKVSFIYQGFADSRGSDSHNLALSQQRALSVDEQVKRVVDASNHPNYESFRIGFGKSLSDQKELVAFRRVDIFAPPATLGSDDRQSAMDKASLASRIQVTNALANLRLVEQQVSAGLSGRVFPGTLRAVQKWLFVTPDNRGEFLRVVRKAIALMESNAQHVGPLAPRAQEDPVHCTLVEDGKIVLAVATSFPGSGVNGEITCCESFFRKNSLCQRNVITHERFHTAGCRQNDAVRVGGTSDQALDAAQNLAELVNEINEDTDLSPCSHD
jgi:peptidoglycan hydrolase-like protein with peptidoglycan-binding domain